MLHSGQTEALRRLAHFRVGDFFGFLQGVVDGGQDQVLQQGGVGGIDGLGINLDGDDRAVAFGHDLDGAAAAAGFDGPGGQLAWVCSICCCMRAACFMSFPMFGMVFWIAVYGFQDRTSTIWPLNISRAF